MMMDDQLCRQFGQILNGQGKPEKGGCSVSLHRAFETTVQGKKSTRVMPADVSFESLDPHGHALNLAEVAVLQEEIPAFIQALSQYGLTISAVHNHWIFTKPLIMYVHIQSVEPPLDFARKIAYAFQFLSSAPISDH
ncbi:DUF1259 domain-containing protein [Edaphobacillus lindanitolerans]|uniref:Uncharacterized protein n=1 Tax=Edaphobacillus lindanitolerans TaxID=550447 RepID=A0A1U7PNM9_9BACI|nr:DUF1259 domain-containing protein [Edaphobacillus lindanitolerans]SIT93012.1 protein of unknown function [Edaphobacillus lindanitolerans]